MYDIFLDNTFLYHNPNTDNLLINTSYVEDFVVDYMSYLGHDSIYSKVFWEHEQVEHQGIACVFDKQTSSLIKSYKLYVKEVKSA